MLSTILILVIFIIVILIPASVWIGLMVRDCLKIVRDAADSEDEESDEDKNTADVLGELQIPLDMGNGSDDLEYETRIQNYLRSLSISIYYSNYSQTSVEVTGKLLVPDYCIEIATSQDVHSDKVSRKTIEEWSDYTSELSSGICYAFRVSRGGTNYLIWGRDREEAFLNLYGFALYIDFNYT